VGLLTQIMVDRRGFCLGLGLLPTLAGCGPWGWHGHDWADRWERGGGPGPDMMGQGRVAKSDVASQLEAQLAALRADLRLTSAQQPAFDVFTRAVLAGAVDTGIGRQARAPERVQARIDAMEAVQAALAKLYGQLDPEQQAVLDRYVATGMRI
jgi:hypothetical protein